jgi:predicted enzyme related to lactoylglutathione lyase
MMAERDGYIPGVPCWVDTSQPDPEAALPFYRGLFGWEFESVLPEASEGKYFIGRIRGGDVAAIGSIPEGAPPMALWNTYIWVESADQTAAKVRDAGGGVAAEPFDVMAAGRMAVLTDPEGAAFCAWQPKDHKGAKVVNEHGSLNFNGLATRDPGGAEAFYGAVFGWKRLVLPAGGMWTLPGYGDHLEERSPGLRKQMEQMAAPEGFIDVVAALNPIADDDSETPAHWSVTFAVDDADATAAKAIKLGGNVITGPFDAPWSRLAVIKDPQGATFIASQFVAENKDLTA